MARKFLDTVRAELNQRVFANESGLVTATNLNITMHDIIDSSIQDEAALSNAALNTITLNLTSAWISISDATASPVIAYDTVVGGDASFLKVDKAAGTITGTSIPGFTYEALGAVTIASATLEVVEASIGVDGVPGELIASNVGSAGNRPESLFLRRYIGSTLPDSAFSLMLRAPDGTANNVEITIRTMGVIVLPTNNP